MARVVVFTQDLGNEESLKRGFVIDILPDGQFAGSCVENGIDVKGELKNYWRILEMPGVDPADLQYLLVRDYKAPDSLDLVPLRKNKLDLDAIELAHKDKAGKLDPKDTITATKAEVDATITIETVKDAGIILPSVSI